MKSVGKLEIPGSAGKFSAAVLFCLLCLPTAVFAKTLAEYRDGVKAAEKITQELIEYVDEASDEPDAVDAGYERETLVVLRRALPVTEKVEWEGTSVETSNEWFESSLKAFEDEPKDWTKRRRILTQVRERLAAIGEKIKQLETPAPAERSKDEEKQKLAEILRRPEYQKPAEQQESWFESRQKKISDWFRDKFPRPDVPEGTRKAFEPLSFALQMLLYAAVLGFIAFLIYRFAPLFRERFKRREKEEKGERVILGEKLAADADAQTLFDEAETLARAGNLRGAVRKGYIALLCELSDRKIIGLAQHKTNRDYLRDVRKKGELYQNMSGLTNSFERHWYGFDRVDEADWNEFKQIYQKTLSS